MNENPIIEHAKKELALIGYIPLDQEQEDGPNKWIQENILELLTVFSNQGHSGSSASYCINMFSKLANFETISPLTGEDEEWVEISEGVFQNRRCGHVFKDTSDQTLPVYDIDGIIFEEPNGNMYTGRYSRTLVQFPYTPSSIIIKVTENGIPLVNQNSEELTKIATDIRTRMAIDKYTEE